MRPCIPLRPRPTAFALAALALAMTVVVDAPGFVARAQTIELTVNGDPITSVDLEQRAKLLRAIRRGGGRDSAVESMIETRLKAREASRFSISIGDNEIGEQVQTDARKLKTNAQALLAAMSNAGVQQDHLRTYFKAELGFLILVKALNRGVEASEIAVRSELAKEKGKNSVQSYKLRQVVFTINPAAGPEAVNASVKQAEALRTRFTSCATGIPYAKSLPGVAVREPLNRTSAQLPDGFKDVLDKTPLGHLTQPSRSANGIELVAVCERGAPTNDDDLRKQISDRLLTEHLAQQEVTKYKELRSRAVITRSK